MKYWLMKSEPSEVSVEDVLAMPNQTVEWFGVRNYQARNFMLRSIRLSVTCWVITKPNFSN